MRNVKESTNNIVFTSLDNLAKRYANIEAALRQNLKYNGSGEISLNLQFFPLL